jgi:hypothetical protein
MFDDPAGVVVLPPLVGLVLGVVAIEFDEEMHEMAADRLSSKESGELGEVDQPVCVPGRPVGIVPVGDSVYDVMGFGGFMQEGAKVLLLV